MKKIFFTTKKLLQNDLIDAIKEKNPDKTRAVLIILEEYFEDVNKKKNNFKLYNTFI